MTTKRCSVGQHLRRGISLLLAICTISVFAPGAVAGSVGTNAAAITDVFPLSFVRLAANTDIFHFQNETTPVYAATTGTVTVPAGTVLILASTSTFTVTDGTNSYEYACIYYNNTQYNVLASSLPTPMTSAEVLSFVTGELWNPTTYQSLKKDLNLKRNVAVYGLQVALQTIGYYSGTLDGSYGDSTEAAVTQFQKAYMSKTDVDGFAGQYNAEGALSAGHRPLRKHRHHQRQHRFHRHDRYLRHAGDQGQRQPAQILLHQNRTPGRGA